MASVSYLIVGGGGSGAGKNNSYGYGGGGGGGGQVLTGTATVNAGTAYTVTVGNGGAAVGNNTAGNAGGSSSVNFTSGTVTALPGNGGSFNNGSGGANGGSSGSGQSGGTAGASSAGGGGGGDSAAGSAPSGSTGGAGGNGTASSISGSSQTYGGGGGGGNYSTDTGSNPGGSGGGGQGAWYSNQAVSGGANTGGGGGGAGGYNNSYQSGAGGTGIVIISATIGLFSVAGTTGGTHTTANGNDIWTFTASGTWTPAAGYTTYNQTVAAVGGSVANAIAHTTFARTLAAVGAGVSSVATSHIFKQAIAAVGAGVSGLKKTISIALHAIGAGIASSLDFRPFEIRINGTDYAHQIDWSSFKKTEVLTYQPDSCSFRIRNVPSKTYRPSLNDDVKVYRDGILIFGGVVISTSETVDGLVKYFIVQCKDYTEALDGVLVAKSYTSQTAAAIVADLITNFAPAGFTHTNTVAPDTVNAIKFNYISLSQCLQNLANALPGYDWYVDYNKDIHFFQSSSVSAPFKLGESGLDIDNFIYGSLQFDADQSQIRNTIVVRGGTVTGSTVTNKQTSDGVQVVYYVGYNLDTTTFTAQHALAATPTTFTSLTVGRDGIDDPASYDCLYNPTLGLIRFVSAYPVGDVVKTSGTPSYPLVSISSDQVSVGTYGTKEFLIQDQNITTKQQAIDRAAAMLAQYSQPLYSGQFTTLKAGLVQGQTIIINLPSRGISGYFKIQQIETTLRTPSNGSADLVFVVSFVSSFNIGIIEILNRLLIQDQANLVPVSANEIPNRIYGPIEVITVGEGFTASKGQTAGTETVTVGEGFVNTGKNYGTIFVAGPQVPSSTLRIFITNGSRVG